MVRTSRINRIGASNFSYSTHLEATLGCGRRAINHVPKRIMKVQCDFDGERLRTRFINDKELPNWQDGPTRAEFWGDLADEGRRWKTSAREGIIIIERDTTVR